MTEFTKWLDSELEQRHWSRADLSRRAKINQSTLSMIYGNVRKPGNEVCNAIAEALHLPPEVVFRHAGLLPPIPDSEEVIEMTLHELGFLSYEDKQEMLELARLKRRIAEERAKYK